MTLPDTIQKIKEIRTIQLSKRAAGYVFVKTNPMLLKKKR
jgi:hypothetical protein